MSNSTELTLTAPDRRITAGDVAALVLGVVAAWAILAGITGPVREVIGVAAFAFLPGWGIVRWFRTTMDRMLISALAVGLSVALGAIGASLMLAADAWNAMYYMLAVITVSMILTVVPAPIRIRPPNRAIPSGRHARAGADPRQSTRGWKGRADNVYLLVLVAGLTLALVLWLISLRPVNPDTLGSFGLLPVYSPLWWIALAIVVVVWIASVVRSLPFVSAGALGVFALVLYGTTAFIETAPRLPYIYKHLAVTRLFETTGQLHPNVDIYNRWPGFFASGALFGNWTGLLHPVSYAAFAELSFAALNAILVFMLARSFSLRVAGSVVAASVFTAANWVGQGYYSPQASAFALYLLMAVIILRFLRGVPIAKMIPIELFIANLMRRRRGAMTSREFPVADTASSPFPVKSKLAVNLGIVVLLQGAIVVSHQLTPYMAVVGFLPIAFLGYVRPRILGFALLAMNLLYLLPNFTYVQEHFGLLSGFNFFENVTSHLGGFGSPTIGNQIQSRVVICLTVLIIVLALVGFFRRARSGDHRSALIVAWLSFAPAVILLGQDYGGEGRLRVVLFSLPWWSIGVAWLVQGMKAKSKKARLLLSIFTVATTSMFTFAWLQPEADNAISHTDINAAEWINSHAEMQDQVVGAVPSHPLFPLTVDNRYPVILQTQINAIEVSTAVENVPLYKKMSGIGSSVHKLEQGAKIYIVFSTGQIHSATLHRVAGYETLGEFESQVADLSYASRVFNNGQDRIYMLTGPAR